MGVNYGNSFASGACPSAKKHTRIASGHERSEQLRTRLHSEFGKERARKYKAERGRIPFMVCNRARTQYFKAVSCPKARAYCERSYIKRKPTAEAVGFLFKRENILSCAKFGGEPCSRCACHTRDLFSTVIFYHILYIF